MRVPVTVMASGAASVAAPAAAAVCGAAAVWVETWTAAPTAVGWATLCAQTALPYVSIRIVAAELVAKRRLDQETSRGDGGNFINVPPVYYRDGGHRRRGIRTRQFTRSRRIIADPNAHWETVPLILARKIVQIFVITTFTQSAHYIFDSVIIISAEIRCEREHRAGGRVYAKGDGPGAPPLRRSAPFKALRHATYKS
ncbi:MAG: hypothetical protein WCC64_10505 [Aliidongia sp.]